MLDEPIRIDKLVHGGQGIGTDSGGRKVFVWNALPGEVVRVRIIKKKRSYLEAIATEIIESSSERTEPREQNYLATSPWQIMNFDAENKYKKEIVKELFQQAHVALPDFSITADKNLEWYYRNKMEYSFWGDEQGLHLALHARGSHQKQIVQGSTLALPSVDNAARSVLGELQKHEVRAGDLKTIIVRANQSGETAVALFVKSEEFTELELPSDIQGLRVYYSNSKSPASVQSKLLQEFGDIRLHDTLLGKTFTYDVDSFFQVNIPIFEQALSRINEYCNSGRIVDMYAGVGSIGLSVARDMVELVELDPSTAAMARINATESQLNTEVVEASTEKALDYISSELPVIFDPPRAGLHDKVVERALAERPPQIIYLSCNPATQARDLAKLQDSYDVEFFEAFNFFPHTPHIETLAILTKKT